MLTQELNERLTQVGRGTPGGELLRRYWWPLAATPEVEHEAVIGVRVLGEDLALYRTASGKLGLVAERCAHRGASLVYGIPEEDGLRCAYHGWRYDAAGQCNETPGEQAGSTFREKVCIAGYPVQELGGLIFGYLGPQPTPLLPRWDVLAREDLKREVGITNLPINWLTLAENQMDPFHLDYLHTRYMNYVMKKQGKAKIAEERRHLDIAFDVWEYGIMKRRLLEGDDPLTSEEWLVGHPLLFPNTLALGGERPRLGYRVPVDDTNLKVYSVFSAPYGPDEPRPQPMNSYEIPYLHEDGRFIVETVLGTDFMACVTQGAIPDRTTERLGTTDRGIILYRKLLQEQIDKVERGEDPMGVIRDPAKNTPMISIPRERDAFFTHTGGMVANAEQLGDDPLAMVRVKKEPVRAAS
ncbi:MAG: Rieske 2Fe-2S domain-containing protein [Chloroflexota bacterium]